MELFNLKNTEYFFDLLSACEAVRDSIIWHPESNVLCHSLQVFGHAMRESNDVDVILAALLHDVGKLIVMHGHEKESVNLLNQHISAKTLFLIKNHMRVKLLISGDMKKKQKVLELVSNPWFAELVLMARWDVMGRNKHANPVFDKEKIIDQLNSKVVLPREVLCKEI